METMEFNLLQERWVRVRTQDCTVQEVSLTDALLHAHAYVDLAGEMPTQDAAMLRLQLAVLHTVFSRVDGNGVPAPFEEPRDALQRWGELWQLGHFPEQPIRDYLDKFQLPWKKTVKELSRGMRMKLSLSAALAHRPRLLILDEATAGLDPVVRDDILEELLAFVSDEDHAVLLSSHITGDLEKIADYITYLHQGQVILSAPKDDILEQYGQVGCSAAQLSALEPELLTRVRRGEFGCHALVADRAAFQRVHPELSVEPVTLDDIMLFVGKGEAV